MHSRRVQHTLCQERKTLPCRIRLIAFAPKVFLREDLVMLLVAEERTHEHSPPFHGTWLRDAKSCLRVVRVC